MVGFMRISAIRSGGLFMVRIITDSSSLYTVEEGRDTGIDSVPLSDSIGDCHGRDLQMDMPQFYKRIDEGHHSRLLARCWILMRNTGGSRLSTSLWPTACREHMRAHAAPEQWLRIRRISLYLTAGPCAVRTVIWWIRPTEWPERAGRSMRY